ncbi:MAG: phasin family protein [Sphingorhabdus sp.]
MATKTNTAKKNTAPKQEKLVTKIVTVENDQTSKGENIMTKTAKNTAEKAKNFTADIRGKAGDVFEKGKKLATDGYDFQKGNVEAMIEAGKIGAKGAQELGQTNFGYAKSNFSEAQSAVKEMTAVKSPTDFVKLQGDFAKKGLDIAVSQASKNTETMVKLFSDMFQPLSNRMAVATDMFKKAA